MLAVRNALDTIYNHQYQDGSMPYAGPPMGAFGEFSDTYHLHTLIGTYFYVLYSGDLAWLETRWEAYKIALEVSIAKVDETGLLHVSSVFDWIRPGMTGHNIEASSLLYEVLGNSLKLTDWLKKKNAKDIIHWTEARARLFQGINEILYCPQDGMYADNLGRRGCYGIEKVLPQDGNSWALMSGVFPSDTIAYNVSENLRKRWIKYGAPAVEFPNVISPFASSFELLGHSAAGNNDAAVELIELMWGYMMDGPGMTNSTLLEGYRTDGYVQYPAYWAAARNSHAHGWAAGPTTVPMQGILGIKLNSPLGKTWTIEPQLTKWLSYARGGFATKLGKFEVDVTLMRSLSTGRKIEALKVNVPEGTTGLVKWGGKEMVYNEAMGTTFSYYRYLDVATQLAEEWQAWSVEDLQDYVLDDTFLKPVPEERPEGVVDWEALEENYGLANQRFTPFLQPRKQRTKIPEDRARMSLKFVESFLADLSQKQRAGPMDVDSNDALEGYKLELKKLEAINIVCRKIIFGSKLVSEKSMAEDLQCERFIMGEDFRDPREVWAMPNGEEKEVAIEEMKESHRKYQEFVEKSRKAIAEEVDQRLAALKVDGKVHIHKSIIKAKEGLEGLEERMDL